MTLMTVALLVLTTVAFVPNASASCATFGPLTVTPEDCVGEGAGLALELVKEAKCIIIELLGGTCPP